MKVHYLIACLLCLQTSQGFSWGEEGHRIAAYLADDLISDHTKASIKKLFKADKPIPKQVTCKELEEAQKSASRALPQNSDPVEPEIRPKTLASISVFADEVRRKPIGDGTAGWHFTNVEIGADKQESTIEKSCSNPILLHFERYDEKKKCYVHLKENIKKPSTDNCSVKKLATLIEQLSAKKTSLAEKNMALKFIVHISGDMHQPLHNANWNKDLGGNTRGVIFFMDPNPFYGPLNLHSIWDSNILERRLKEHFKLDLNANHNFKEEELKSFAVALKSQLKDEERAVWSRDSYFKVLWDAHHLAETYAYKGFSNPFIPIPKQRPIPKDAKFDRVPISSTYYADAKKVVDRQLQRAGVQLAKILDESFKNFLED